MDINFIKYKDRIQFKKQNNKLYFFDPIRQKYLLMQPEEMVRQLVVLYLIQEKSYNKNRIKLEKTLTVNDRTKRCDILIYDLDMQPFLLVECKAPHIKISHDVFKQIAWYNMPLKVSYLLVTNGIQTYCCAMNYQSNSFEFLDYIPEFSS